MEFREPTLFEYLLHDVEKYNSKTLQEKLAVCSVFAVYPLKQAAPMREMIQMASEFEKFIGGNVISFRR